MGIADEKAVLRAAALARRDGLDAAVRDAASCRIADRVVTLAARWDGPISVFWPIRSEVDTRLLIDRLHEAGWPLALPSVGPDGLSFRLWRPGEPLRGGRFGLSEPHDHHEAVAPATLLVPLAAFDRRCHRIGYGAGYYDRAIENLSRVRAPLTVGLAFAAQEVEHVPVEAHDRSLDMVLTERELVMAPGARG